MTVDSRPYSCPVCLGRGFVTTGFYQSVMTPTFISAGGTEECHACKGTGIVWSPENIPGITSYKVPETTGGTP
jgi:DnaJ-class molecular chaperone